MPPLRLHRGGFASIDAVASTTATPTIPVSTATKLALVLFGSFISIPGNTPFSSGTRCCAPGG